MRYAINGLLSLTCDGLPILGESDVEGAVDRGRGLDQGGAGRRPRGRRVDDPRLERDRRQPQRHRAVPRAPEAPRAHPAAHHRVVHQDLRHHPPGRAVRVRPQPAALADVRLPAEAGRVLLRDRRLGAAALVRVQRRPARAVRRRGDAARARVGLALVEPDHQRRAPADARGRGRHRPVGVPDLRHRGRRCALASVQRPASRSATSPSARSSTRRCSTPTAASAPTSP